MFFTVVGRDEKYKAKNFIDVVVYRGSDALYGWVFDSLQAIGLKLGAVALCALPLRRRGWRCRPRWVACTSGVPGRWRPGEGVAE